MLEVSRGMRLLQRLKVLNEDPEAFRACLWRYGCLPRVPLTSVFVGIQNIDVTIHRAFDRTLGTSVDL